MLLAEKKKCVACYLIRSTEYVLDKMAGHAGAGLTLARWPPMPRWQTMDPHESM